MTTALNLVFLLLYVLRCVATSGNANPFEHRVFNEG